MNATLSASLFNLLAKDGDAPALDYEKPSGFVSVRHKATVNTPTNISATKVPKPDRRPDVNTPEPHSCPVWIGK